MALRTFAREALESLDIDCGEGGPGLIGKKQQKDPKTNRIETLSETNVDDTDKVVVTVNTIAFHGTHTEDHRNSEEEIRETVNTDSTDEESSKKDCIKGPTYTHTFEDENLSEVALHSSERSKVENTLNKTDSLARKNEDRENNRKEHPKLSKTGDKSSTRLSRTDDHDNLDNCVASLTELGSVPGMGGYNIIKSRSEVSEKHAKKGLLASDMGRGSGTPLTVLSSPGVEKVAGADTDESVAKIVCENGRANGPIEFEPMATRGNSVDKAMGKPDAAVVNTAVDAATTPLL